jgi:hypothetical protein
MPKTLHKLTLIPANLWLAYHFYIMQYYPESFTKALQFYLLLQIQPFYAEWLLCSCNSTEYYSITLSFSYTSLSSTITKTHFTPDFTKEILKKSRFDILLYAKLLLLYNMRIYRPTAFLYPLFGEITLSTTNFSPC